MNWSDPRTELTTSHGTMLRRRKLNKSVSGIRGCGVRSQRAGTPSIMCWDRPMPAVSFSLWSSLSRMARGTL